MSPRNAESREGFESRGRLSRPAVVLAAGVSCGVVAASAVGALSTPVVVGALGVAVVIGAVSVRHSSLPAPAHVFASLDEQPQAVVVDAPKASDLVAAPPISSSDVA